MPSRQPSDRGSIIDQISIRIMLNHVARCVPPVVEDLAAQDVASHAPDALVTLVCQPLVSKLLRIEIMDLKRAVMDVRGIVGAEEDGVVIDQLLAAVDVGEYSDVGPGAAVVRGDVEDIGGREVEVARVPVKLLGKVLDTEAVVAELCVLVSLKSDRDEDLDGGGQDRDGARELILTL